MLRLGLDIGANSIGWALVDTADKKIVNAGVRVFKEGLDNYDTGKETSLNEQRRSARGSRRQTRRRAARRELLKKSLIETGLFPANAQQQQKLYADQDLYKLRAKAVEEKIELQELGRILLYLQRHRGFWSPRKGQNSKENGAILAEINELQEKIESNGCKTIGQYLAKKQAEFKHTERSDDDHIRNRHTRRSMIMDEFEVIWEKQKQFHPDILTEDLKYGKTGKQKFPVKPISKKKPGREQRNGLEHFGLFGLCFFQRPIYWPASAIGFCELEPKQRRCDRNERYCQRFRVLTEINNLRYIDPITLQDRQLTSDQREVILKELATKEKLLFTRMRKLLNFKENIKFNLEEGKRKFLKGFTTDVSIAKAIGNDWHKRDENQKTEIVELLLSLDKDEERLIETLQTCYGFTLQQAEALLSIDFKVDRSSLSKKAILKLLPHLEKGLLYQANDMEDSALHAAGYLRRDQLQKRIFGRLPLPERMKDCSLNNITNPVVRRSLMQLRKVVNSIIREYGRPDRIHIELTRQMQLGKKKRNEIIAKMRENEKLNNNAVDVLRAKALPITRDSIERYRFWKEQNECCMYCGKTINLTEILTGDIDIDHILPISLSHDNSKSNKVLCHRRCNHEKGRKTVIQWLEGKDNEKLEQIKQRALALFEQGKLSSSKRRKLFQRDIDKDFTQNQLTDTGYMSRAAMEYLRCLFEKDSDILGLKGQYTSILRREWGLNTVLSQMSSPAWNEDKDMTKGEKDRADHRHHAIDAVILALTDNVAVQNLCSNFGYGMQLPWEDFRQDVFNKLKTINVSTQVNRGISGPLHEESNYGPVYDKCGNKIESQYVIRKDITALSSNEIEKIRDNQIKRLVKEKLEAAGLSWGRGKNISPKQMAETLSDLKMPSGVPVRKVRILKDEKSMIPIRDCGNTVWVKPGNTHHLTLFEWIDESGNKKRDAVFVSMLEAKERNRDGLEMIDRKPPENHQTIPADAQFIMSLGKGEMVLLEHNDQELLTVFKTAASTSKQLIFGLHTDARQSKELKKITRYPSTFIGRKVTVDPLGRIRWAND